MFRTNCPRECKLKIFVSRTALATWGRLAALGLCAIAAGCGGGGGGGGASLPIASTTTGTAATTTTTTPVTTIASGSNVATISVDTGPSASTGQVNIPYVSVTVCATNGSNCQTIDHITVDTGSVGLRLMASAIGNRAALSPVVDSSSAPLVECAQFASGFTWGSVKLANVSISGKSATSVPIQIIGDPDFVNIPSSCSNTGSAQNTVQSFGSNGLLGVGSFRQDCGTLCAARAIAGTYYSCPSGASCESTTMPLARQVANPVALFAGDNNGVLVQLPSIPASGATNVTGALVFGIGTRDNNALGSAKAYGLSAQSSFVATVGGVRYANAFLDSGSNFYYFDTTALASCPTTSGFNGFYCPASTTLLGVTFQGLNGATGSGSISIANAVSQVSMNPNATAYSNIGTRMNEAGGFDFGLPFFFGRNVFTAIEDASTPAGTGPYVAF